MSLEEDVKLCVVSIACTLLLVTIPENLIHVQLDFASKYAPLLVFIFYLFLRDEEKNSPLPWYFLMIYATAGILILKMIDSFSNGTV
ncbi:MAG: hypothetical protein WBI12_00140 [Methanosarcina flavescens]|jgi:hypothetical protein|uniref:DUF8049 domain-containing protein n=1 Tax=Methanosarcina flavescens TaxID=1715806 RepID=A0A660HPH5_9EURY|nr:hypothetical protein [Methanosarcina flavescens]AYK14170.1 hypothetical protein AOB57_002250 [Methanosarcina flavescens]NLK33149.1 hypothetical protein [Methanosarcina flavescens]